MSRRHIAGIGGTALLLAGLVLFGAGCQPLPAPTPPASQAAATLPGPLDLTIVHSNDTWGYVNPCG